MAHYKFQKQRSTNSSAMRLKPIIRVSSQTDYSQKQPEDNKPIGITDVCNSVVHPVSGETITKYKTLAKDAVTKPVWEEPMCT